ncbi:hypothetical protein [uncultured Methanobrevibacter sp.]|uniref:hypothetical protein n=1 Tax=uncultured Methanobrevibacter sp. TaxID=253161 RepID=UPI0025FAC0CE|nr:hypothetical protein [uncultured Methanobrevibacter sp.]
MSEKLSYDDVKQYEHLFSLVPSFMLERMAKKNRNLVDKFKSKIQPRLESLSDNQRNKYEMILNSDVDELQSIMAEAYEKTDKKQYKILANPEYRKFIETNIEELKKL